jgi:hypothetical protein
MKTTLALPALLLLAASAAAQTTPAPTKNPVSTRSTILTIQLRIQRSFS